MKGVPEATIPWTECLADIIFSWDDPDDGSHVHFNITRLEQLMAYAVDVSIWGQFLVKMPEELEIESATSIPWSGLP